jgi:phage terminase large subunit GpA-like protein
MSKEFERVRREARHVLIPPQRLSLARWIEDNLVLPSSTAVPGRIRLYKFQRGIADAISSPEFERVTLVKAIRIGLTTLISGAIGSLIVNDPSPTLVLRPTESDCRDYMVSDVEPIFAATPALQGVLEDDKEEGKRNTILGRHFKGGSLKVIPAVAPHNLRGHTARNLFCDEVDAMEHTSEGNPLRLAEGRTLSFPNRKIVIGSTPKYLDTSLVLAAYRESDQRIFEVPCPACGAMTEIKWKHIVWPKDRPEEAAFQCPHCNSIIGEEHKAQMVEAGEWRATRPDIKGHAGFLINALISPLANARWGILAQTWLEAQSDPANLQVFVNQVLAEGWATPSLIDDSKVAARAEAFDLGSIPEAVISLTCGVDVQDDRLELVICGWNQAQRPDCYVLAHRVVHGHFTDPRTWQELDAILLSKFQHSLGGLLHIDGCVVDAGDGDYYGTVLDFANTKDRRRRIWAGKGYYGPTRSRFEVSKDKNNRLAVIGVDALKAELFDKMQRGQGIHFSSSLEPVFYQQLASEHRVVRMKSGMPVGRFERIGNARAEALDALVYATASQIEVWKRMPYDIERRLLQLRTADGDEPLSPPSKAPAAPPPEHEMAPTRPPLWQQQMQYPPGASWVYPHGRK